MAVVEGDAVRDIAFDRNKMQILAVERLQMLCAFPGLRYRRRAQLSDMRCVAY